MDEKEREILKAKAKEEMIAMAYAPNPEMLIAKTVSDVYEVEFPVPEVVGAVFNFDTAEKGEHYYYMVPKHIDKKVLTLQANCNVTHELVSPDSRTELTFTTLVSPDYYVCIDDLLSGDHDVLKLYGEDISEALDRQEVYATLVLLSAAATTGGTLFTPSSGETKFTYTKLISMRKAIRKYGKNLVLITGANVTEDVELMDYDADKNRPIDIMNIVDKWIPIESLEVIVDGSTKDVIDDDVAYLVAVSDSKKNKPGYWVRRKVASLGSSPDTTVVAKERAVMATGNMKSTDSVDKFARGIAGLQQTGAVVTNYFTIAKFTR